MAILFSLDFNFERVQHTCLVRTKIIENTRFYKITVMNGELERMLYPDNYIKEEGGVLEIPLNRNLRHQILKYEITVALQQYLNNKQESPVKELNSF